MSNSDQAATLARLKQMRDSGITSTTVDGVATSFRSLSELRQTIIAIERDMGYRPRKVRARSVFMGHR